MNMWHMGMHLHCLRRRDGAERWRHGVCALHCRLFWHRRFLHAL